jgi:hypothetical protein
MRLIAATLAIFICLAGDVAMGQTVGGENDGSEDEASNILEAVKKGTLSINLRYRYEVVNDDTFSLDARASTLRTALGFETAALRGFSVGIVFEDVTAVGSDTLYNNAGAPGLDNGVTDRPVVADPEITEIDRVYLAYRGWGTAELRVGRFDYRLDNQRFVGTAPWRQNERSFNAVAVGFGTPKVLRGRYAYLDRVHYNNGASPGISAHLFHVARAFSAGGLSGYAYLLDWDSEELDGLSSGTFGARFQGETNVGAFDLLYHAEYARQIDYSENPEDFALNYVHLGLGGRRGPWSAQLGWELKDGDGTSAVQTPLGTNHGKNGFADKLVVTPPVGSHDIYVRLNMNRPHWSWLLAYHNFRAAQGDAVLGSELDFQGNVTPWTGLSFHFKLARYWADTFSEDTTKVMVWAAWSFEVSPGG